MSVFLLSPTERALHSLGESSSIPEEYGADILIPGNGFFLGVQRKVFPGDFLSSLYDGRLATSLVKLTKCEKRVLLLEGKPSWTTSGFLVSDYVEFSRAQLRNLLMSAHSELDIHTIWSDNVSDTMDVLRDLSRWALKDRHDSIFVRPDSKDRLKRRWTKRDYAVHFLQGFDGVGPELARRIFDHFGRVPLSIDDEEELLKVKGMGPGRLKKMKGILL